MDYKREIQNLIKDSIRNIKEKRNKILEQQRRCSGDLDTIMGKIEVVTYNVKNLTNITQEELDLISPFLTEQDI